MTRSTRDSSSDIKTFKVSLDEMVKFAQDKNAKVGVENLVINTRGTGLTKNVIHLQFGSIPPSRRPDKLPALISAVQTAIVQGRYLYSKHALERQHQRKITRPEVLQVLNNGYHEKAKDAYSKAFQAWNYAIRGRTLDGRELRIVVNFDDNGLLIITAIDLKA